MPVALSLSDEPMKSVAFARHAVRGNPCRGFYALALLFFLLPAACSSPEKLPSQVLLTVNDRTVSLERFQHEFEQLLPRDRALPEQEEQALRRSFLAQLIDHQLLLGEAANLHLSVSARELGKAVQNHLGQYPPGEFERTLAKKGLSADAWKQLLQEELLVEKVLQRMIRDKIKVDETDISAYFEANRQSFSRPEQVRARQITVADETQGRKVLGMLHQGLPFDEAARRYSVSPDAAQGGDLGLFARGEMPEAFDAAVFGLPVGHVSDLVKTEYGYHIFLVEAHRPPSQPALETVRQEIVALLSRQQEERLYQEWLQTLRQKASIEVDWALL
jgi:parvulin-like peptidyl-prolyl isomerase